MLNFPQAPNMRTSGYILWHQYPQTRAMIGTVPLFGGQQRYGYCTSFWRRATVGVLYLFLEVCNDRGDAPLFGGVQR